MKANVTVCVTIMIGIAFSIYSAEKDNILEGWNLAGNNRDNYTIEKDLKIMHSGKSSGCIQSKNESQKGFGTLIQTISAGKYAGKRVRMSGYLKAENVKQWAGMWMRIDNNENIPTAFDNMENRPLKGNSDWKKYEIVLDAATSSSKIVFGVLLDGAGKVWMDDVIIEIVDLSVETTRKQVMKEAINLDFEK